MSIQNMLTKIIFSCTVMVVIAVSCSSSAKNEDQQSWKVTVRGQVQSPQPGTIVIQGFKAGKVSYQDTIRLRPDNTFNKQVQVTEPGYYKMNFFNMQSVDLIINKTDLYVTVQGNDRAGFAEVKGSPEIDVIRKAQSVLQTAEQSPLMVRLNDEFTKAAQVKDEAKMLTIQQEYMNELDKIHLSVAEMLKKEPASLGVINFLQNNTSIDKDKYLDLYIQTAEKAKKAWPTNEHSVQFSDMVDKMKVTAIGQVAPEIALPDTTGQIVKLSSLRGKYVLVDFWAKWCGPCRQENPNVVKAFQKYKNNGFTVFGVSLDRSKQDWMRAIAEDNLTWTHVSDLKFWQSEAAKAYNVTGIPFSLLLDQNGVIIAKNLRGRALDAKLAEILNKAK
jgi:peroxiredoxin